MERPISLGSGTTPVGLDAVDDLVHARDLSFGSSSFKDMGSAQRLTEHNLRARQSEIDAWLATNPPEGKTQAFTSPAPGGEVSGRYVSKQPTADPDGRATLFRGPGTRTTGSTRRRSTPRT
ncbi:RNase A-like domain-containing protein [Streptomyces sp. NPDC002476]|uniref:RNase A-like domain-containing protein n=1 Tax=Streptomyces sp. NPDC002476 TaxID=3364648 RepID=UPI0036A31F05